ncbi:MAG: acetolactate synthase small subunit [Chloroflexi bacterium]|nr:acetolactate synthase small subunit [Chloroflexota bacterium]MCH2308337.1 acetolactate synthase small subunit [SAR202 cluster bacterium]MQG05304.1 acetolactate synthase small subunit [SAR202 cluster bacterium]|tara:strand:+ start:1135 stop:1704 length:570 start_codon:yes stop_codon:yes gene_type:complete
MNNHSQTSKHTISALVLDKPGVLNRISSMFRRRGFNIASLAVGQSENPDLSRMTFVVVGNNSVVEQVTKHLNKLIDVIKVLDLSSENVISRELALFRINSSSQARSEIMNLSNIFRANVVDIARNTMILEITGDEEKIVAFEEMLRPFGIIEIMRTGTISLKRGMDASTSLPQPKERKNQSSWGEAASV